MTMRHFKKINLELGDQLFYGGGLTQW